jgi:hypothetical protein
LILNNFGKISIALSLFQLNLLWIILCWTLVVGMVIHTNILETYRLYTNAEKEPGWEISAYKMGVFSLQFDRHHSLPPCVKCVLKF